MSGRNASLPFAPGSDTSKDAAVGMRAHAGRLRARVLDYLRTTPATAERVSMALGMRLQTVTARIHELRTSGAVVDLGGCERTTSGRWAVIWHWSGKEPDESMLGKKASAWRRKLEQVLHEEWSDAAMCGDDAIKAARRGAVDRIRKRMGVGP